MVFRAFGDKQVRLRPLKDVPHVLLAPTLVSCDLYDIVPLALGRQARDSRIMHRTAPKCGRPGVVDPQHLCPLRRLQSHVKLPFGSPPRHPLVPELPLRVVRVLDEEVPARALVIARRVEVGDLAIDGIIGVVVAGVDQERAEAGPSEVGGQGAAARPRAHDYVVPLLGVGGDVGRKGHRGEQCR